MDPELDHALVQLELPRDLLCRLLRERRLVASDFRCINERSRRIGRWALKRSLVAGNGGDESSV